MNRMLGWVAALAFVVVGATTAEAGDTLNRVMQNKKLINAVDAEYPPFSFRNANNEMDGFDVDVAKEVAKRLGVELEHVTPSWDVITAGKWAGRWDICVGSMTATKERGEVLDFPAQYYFVNAVILAHQDSNITGPADLAGKRIGVQVATTYERYLQRSLEIDAAGAPPVTYEIADPQIVSYDEEPLGVEDLSLGDDKRLDAMLVGQLTAEDYIKNGKPLKLVGEALFAEPIAVAIDKGDPEFAAKIVEIINAMRADGTLKKLSIDRLGIDITVTPSGS
ncbi:MAG: transporter substrate-binding domain-containing protein [Dongiaceae bacterium]